MWMRPAGAGATAVPGRPRDSISVVKTSESTLRRIPLADQEIPKSPPDLIYEDTGALAPVVYFDIVGAYGTMHSAIEVELATRILVPKLDGTTEVKFISSARLRCSATAAKNLRDGLDAALKMLQQPEPTVAVAASRMN